MRRVLPVLPFVLYAVGLQAQVPLSGAVTDPSGAPVAWATVVWHDGNVQRGAVTDEAGTFRMERPGRPGMLTFRCVGYRTVERPLAAEESELGVQVLEEESVGVGAVTVTVRRTERRGDRFILHVGDTPAEAGKNGEELLREAPGVWVDDSGVRVNGAGGVKLYLDDRELHLSPEEQSAWLRTLAAADVTAVEVVPQTGAEQAADTQGGIVRIRTRHAASHSAQRKAGIRLGLNTVQSDRTSRYLANLSAEATAGRWSLYASASGDFTPRDRSRFAEVRAYFGPAEEYASLSEGNTRRNCGRGRAGLKWSPGRRHRLGIEAEYTASADRLASTVRTRMGGLLSASDYLQRQDREQFAATLSYTWELDTAGSALKLLADYTRDRAESDNDYATRYPEQRDTLYFSCSSARHNLWSIGLSLEKRLSGRCILRTGIRYAGNRAQDRSAYAAQSEGGREPLPAFGGTLDCTEHTTAAYASLDAEAGRWSLSAGLRGEYTRIVGPGSDYAALFPHLSVSCAFDEMRNWMLIAQYGRYIERPSFAHLNPARIQLSEYSYSVGNPALRPVLIRRLMLTLVWKYRHTLTVGGNLHRNLIREVCRIDPEQPETAFILPENHYREEHWFAALNLPLQPATWWSLRLNAVGVWQRIELVRGAGTTNHPLAFLNGTSGFTLPAGFYFEVAYDGHSQLYSGTSGIRPRHLLSLTLKKRFFDNRLTLLFGCRNLTDRGESYFSLTDAFRIADLGHRGGTGRRWQIGLSWRPGRGKRPEIGRIESGAADRRRLEGSAAEKPGMQER